MTRVFVLSTYRLSRPCQSSATRPGEIPASVRKGGPMSAKYIFRSFGLHRRSVLYVPLLLLLFSFHLLFFRRGALTFFPDTWNWILHERTRRTARVEDGGWERERERAAGRSGRKRASRRLCTAARTLCNPDGARNAGREWADNFTGERVLAFVEVAKIYLTYFFQAFKGLALDLFQSFFCKFSLRFKITIYYFEITDIMLKWKIHWVQSWWF